jgi:hypothetical protein
MDAWEHLERGERAWARAVSAALASAAAFASAAAVACRTQWHDSAHEHLSTADWGAGLCCEVTTLKKG